MIHQIPETTKYYHWPTAGRGELIVREKDYQRMNKLLLKQAYANLNIAKTSTETWLKAVAAVAKVDTWGQVVKGRKEVSIETISATQPAVATLNTGLIKKKKKRLNDETQEAATEAKTTGREKADTAGSMASGEELVSKRPKLE